jgi:hypothetical protein
MNSAPLTDANTLAVGQLTLANEYLATFAADTT